MLGADPASRDREFRARIGIVLQSAGFYQRATVRESVELLAKAYPPRDAAETIALVGLEDKADARIKTPRRPRSGGWTWHSRSWATQS